MNLFKHKLLPREELMDEIIEGVGRVYQTPIGPLRSVTTIIGEKLDHSGLDAWRERVGAEEAERVGQQARTRGTAIHSLAEKFLMNDPYWAKGAMPANVFTFKKMIPTLVRDVELIYGIEFPLYSRILKTAGRSDLPAVFRGKNSIVDFKTSKREKRAEHIEGYFIQSAAYSLMFEERTGVAVPKIAIIIAVDDGDCQVFTDDAKNWYRRVSEVFCA